MNSDVRVVREVVSIIKQIKDRYDEVVRENQDLKYSRGESWKSKSSKYESKEKSQPPSLSNDDDIPPYFFEMMVERLKKENYELKNEVEELKAEVEKSRSIPPPRLSDEVLSLSPSSLPYMEELQSLRDNNIGLTEELKRMKKENGVLYFEIKEMSEKIKEQREENSSITSSNEKLLREKKKMKLKLKKKSGTSGQPNEDLSKDFEKQQELYEDEIDRLSLETKKLKEQFENSEVEKNRLLEENMELREKYVFAPTPIKSPSRDLFNNPQLFELEEKNKGLQGQVDRFSKLASQKDDTLKKSLEKYNELQMENYKLEQELEESTEKFRSQLEDKDLQISTLNDTLEISTSQSLNIDFNFDSDDEKGDEEELKKKLNEQSTTIINLEKKLQEIEDEKSNAIQELERKRMKKKFSESSADDSFSTKENEEIRLDLEEDVLSWKSKFEDMSELYGVVKNKNEELVEENKNLSMNLEEVNKSFSREGNEDETIEWKEKYEDLDEEKENIKKEKTSLEKDNEKLGLKNRDLSNQIDKLQISFEEATEDTNELTLREEVLKSKNEELESQNNELLEKNNSLLKKYDLLLISQQEISQKLQREEEKHKELKESLSNEDEKEEDDVQEEEWEEKYEKLKKEMEGKESERDNLKKENEKLSEEFSKMNSENTNFKEEIEKKSSETSELEKELEDLKKQNLEVLDQMKTTDEKLESKNKELENVSKKCETLKELNDTLESKLFSEQETQQLQQEQEEEELKKVEELEKESILKDSQLSQQKERIEELEEELEKTKNTLKPVRSKLMHRRSTSVVSYNGPEEEVESLQQRVNLLTEQLQRYISPPDSLDEDRREDEGEEKKEQDGVRFVFEEATREKKKQEIIIPKHHPILNYLVYTKNNSTKNEINMTEVYSGKYKLCDFQSHLLFFDFLLSQQQQQQGDDKEEEEEDNINFGDLNDESSSLSDLLLEESFGSSRSMERRKEKKKNEKKFKIVKLKELENKKFDEQKLLSRRQLEDWEYDYIDEVIAFHQPIQKNKNDQQQSNKKTNSIASEDDDNENENYDNDNENEEEEEEEEGEMKSGTGSLNFLIPFLKLTERVVSKSASTYMTFIFLYYLSEEIELELSELCGGDQFLSSYTIQTVPSTQKMGVSYDDFNDLVAREYQIAHMESREKLIFLDCFSERRMMKKIILSCLDSDFWDEAILQNFGETLVKINRNFVSQKKKKSSSSSSSSRVPKNMKNILNRDDLELLRVQLKCVFDNHEMESFTFFFFYELESDLEVQEIMRTQLSYLFDTKSLLSSFVQAFMIYENRGNDDDDDDDYDDNDSKVNQFVVCLELRNTQSRESAGRIVRDGIAPLLHLTHTPSSSESGVIKVSKIECQCEMDEYRPHLLSNLEMKKESLRKTVQSLQTQIYNMNQHKLLQKQQKNEEEENSDDDDDDGFSSLKKEVLGGEKKKGEKSEEELKIEELKLKNCINILDEISIHLTCWRDRKSRREKRKKKEEEGEESDEEEEEEREEKVITKDINPQIFEWLNRYFIRHRKEDVVKEIVFNPNDSDYEEDEDEGEYPPRSVHLILPLTFEQVEVLSRSTKSVKGGRNIIEIWINEIIPSLPMIRTLGFWEEEYPPKTSLLNSFFDIFIPFLNESLKKKSGGEIKEIEGLMKTLEQYFCDPDWIQLCHFVGNNMSNTKLEEEETSLQVLKFIVVDQKLISSQVIMRYYLRSGFILENEKYRQFLISKCDNFVVEGREMSITDVGSFPIYVSITARSQNESTLTQFVEFVQKIVFENDHRNKVDVKTSGLDKLFITLSVNSSNKKEEEDIRYPLDLIMEQIGKHVKDENRSLLAEERLEIQDVNILDRNSRRRKEELLNQCKVYQNLYTNRLQRFQDMM